ncbi:MAG: diguanylate cyclase [Bdellovibrionales bacterium]|nr:diguanylate cyclase [Bdellovibrionales bacterium]
MSIVDTYKNQFRIFSYDEDVSRSSMINEMFRSQGYDFATFNDREVFLETIENQLPHIFILYYQPLNMKFREVLSRIRKLSPEVEVILLGSNDFWPGIRSLIDAGLVTDFWSWPLASREALKLRVNKVIEKTIFKYIAEQRSEESQKIVAALDRLQQNQTFQASSPSVELAPIPESGQSEPRLIEDLIGQLKKSHPQADFAYIKNYKAKSQLLVMRTTFCKESYYRGQALPMDQQTLTEDKETDYKRVRALIEESFAANDFLLQPIEFAGETFGFLVAIHLPESMKRYLQRSAHYLALSLRNISLESQDANLATTIFTDSLQVDNSQFFRHLSREVARSRRIEKPVSMILTHVQFAMDEQKERKEFIHFLNENLRSYDFFAEVSESEIAIVLPHCDFEGAAIKAERLRRMILKRGMETQNTPLRLCFGVTEYPRLSSDSDQMMMDSKAACDQVLASGNNKVCLFAPPPGFEPEFTL